MYKYYTTNTNEPRHDETNKVTVRPAKTQISLGIRPDWPESSLSAWRKLESLATHSEHREDSDQTGRMPRLIWVFARRTVILLVLSFRGSNKPWHITQGTYKNYKWNFGEVDVAPAKNDKVNKVEKWQKLTAGLNSNHMHIFKPRKKKDVQSCIKISMKLYKELRLQGTDRLYTFIESEVRKWQSSQSGKSEKN